MTRRVARAALALLLVGSLGALGSGPAPLLAPGPARADVDPASDVLLGQNVFLPYSVVDPALVSRLYTLSAAAAGAGYPVRVALIAAPSDLGVVPALFGAPVAYARFLSNEIGGAVSGPVLVVMPAGYGLARKGRPIPLTSLAGIRIGSGTDGLAARQRRRFRGFRRPPAPAPGRRAEKRLWTGGCVRRDRSACAHGDRDPGPGGLTWGWARRSGRGAGRLAAGGSGSRRSPG